MYESISNTTFTNIAKGIDSKTTTNKERIVIVLSKKFIIVKKIHHIHKFEMRLD